MKVTFKRPKFTFIRAITCFFVGHKEQVNFFRQEKTCSRCGAFLEAAYPRPGAPNSKHLKFKQA